ncbi:hypothetical protein [Parafannyhessea umbonata]|uniref:hypothetical protein n=1 Tax=Parafannyhessea umbonata TaxID=604330 RepID=UPI0012B2E63C|nr:hypothetical protein [Parafannyhessea umbonata]
MMLELTTERKALEFKLDGKECSLPLELGLDETRSMGEAFAKAKSEAEVDGAGDEGKFRGGVAMAEWFVAFAERYAPGAKGLSFEAASALMNAWQEARSEGTGVSEGE